MLQARGFTLVELVVTLAIMAIIATWAVPTWQHSVQRAQVESASGSLTQALSLARSEAVTRGAQVSVCPSSGTSSVTACGSDWHNGWVVYLGDSASFQPADRLRIHRGSKAQQTLGGPARVTFNARGILSTGNDSWIYCSGEYTTRIILAPSGRTRRMAGGACE
ncbi:GspH/FimT family pseudopilin [Halomonas sp. PR-M31]|uniref:GspH/FimT family pseudopilin n=1 Tax=Halomonas sp. PR-M31 TaxID=1471202 RepID=UPI00069D9836|nr:GspH/FimT family pseudopilin [Halomonas sp. PR-M31]